MAARFNAVAGSEAAPATPAEVVAHLGDTEFAVLLHTPSGTDADALRTRALALQQALQLPVRLGTTDVYPQCRIGIATHPADGDTSAQLLERAQTARLDVQGGQGVAFFHAATTQRALRAMQIESALWQALERNEFELHYQPQVDLGSGTVIGAEALLRWQSPELGPVSPGEFIPVAERSGLIGAIGDWVLEQACRQIGAWRRAGLRTLRIGVNLAPAQLQQPDLAARVQALLLQHGADPAWLGVELTESMVMADVDGAAATLRAIKAIGVEIFARRLRHRLFEPQLPGAAAAGRRQGRPLVRARRDRRRPRRVGDAGDHPHDARAADARAGRGRRDRGPAEPAGGSRLRRIPGLLVQPPDPGDSVRSAGARRHAAARPPHPRQRPPAESTRCCWWTARRPCCTR